jgi:hypothetical protein
VPASGSAMKHTSIIATPLREELKRSIHLIIFNRSGDLPVEIRRKIWMLIICPWFVAVKVKKSVFPMILSVI